MELVDGTDLETLVRSGPPLQVATACELVRQAACGLQHAMTRGLTHRDLKPANLILTRQGVVKILDMGLARLRHTEEGLTTAGQILGTPDYMAPEQWEGADDLDVRTDIYSLGCTFFCLLVGRPPFAGVGHSTLAGKMCLHLEQHTRACGHAARGRAASGG